MLIGGETIKPKVRVFFFVEFFEFLIDLLISEVKKKKMRKRREK
jgi:hypothetical protein